MQLQSNLVCNLRTGKPLLIKNLRSAQSDAIGDF